MIVMVPFGVGAAVLLYWCLFSCYYYYYYDIDSQNDIGDRGVLPCFEYVKP